MHSTSIQPDILIFEGLLGHSDQCHGCGKTFLSFEEGSCPHCGSVMTSSATSLLPKEVIRKGPYVILWSKKEGLRIVSNDQPNAQSKTHVPKKGKSKTADFPHSLKAFLIRKKTIYKKSNTSDNTAYLVQKFFTFILFNAKV